MKLNSRRFSTSLIVLTLIVVSYFTYRIYKMVTGAPIASIPTEVLYPSPTSIPNIDTSGWKTYQNNTYNYSVKYPLSWTEQKYTDDRSGIAITSDNMQDSITFIVSSLPLYIADASRISTQLNGYPAIKWSDSYYDVSLKNAKHLVISLYVYKQKEVIDQFLSTFHLEQ